MGVDADRDQVHTVGSERAAAQQAAGAQSQPAPETVHRERLHRVGRAARVETTRGDTAGGRALIGGDESDGGTHGKALSGLGGAHAGTRPRPAFTRALATSRRKAAGSSVAAAGSSRRR